MTDEMEKVLRKILAAQILTLQALLYLIEQPDELESDQPRNNGLRSESRPNRDYLLESLCNKESEGR